MNRSLPVNLPIMKTSITLLVILLLHPISAQITGFAEHWLANPAGTGSEFQERRDRLRMDAEFALPGFTIRTGGELTQDTFSRPALYWRLRNAYIEWQGQNIGLRAGVQQVIWGRTQYTFLLDHINPRDWRYFYTWSQADIRQGLPLIRARASLGENDLEIIWIPHYVEDPVVTWGPWSTPTAEVRFIDSYTVLWEKGKNPDPSNHELGLRWAGRLAGTDYRLMWFSGFQDEPVAVYTGTVWQGEPGNSNSDVTVSYYEDHPRQDMLGLDLERVWGPFSITGEFGRQFAYYINSSPAFDSTYHFNTTRLRRERWLGMLGLEIRMPGQMKVAGQLIYRRIGEGGLTAAAGQTDREATVSFRAPLPALSLVCEIWQLMDLTDNSRFTQGSFTWQYSSQIQIQAGLTLLSGRTGTPFGRFANNDHYFLAARFVF